MYLYQVSILAVYIYSRQTLRNLLESFSACKHISFYEWPLQVLSLLRVAAVRYRAPKKDDSRSDLTACNVQQDEPMACDKVTIHIVAAR